MAKVLVVGGAGYVGSATCAWLIDRGHSVWVLDNLSTGHREMVLNQGFTLCDAGDVGVVSDLLSRERFDCVMHFAARSLVAESVTKRQEYFENNVEQTKRLLETLLGFGVRHFVFSSTCAVFGEPASKYIDESLPKKPVNPYGETKLVVENLLEEFAKQKGLRAIALRYFNAAGADPLLRVGEWHEPETHLIPRVLKAALNNEIVEIYGTDYPTPDGTCVRDYVHVSDLALAHEAAMERLLSTSTQESAGKFESFNLGSENGYSVRQVIEACEEVTGKKIRVVERDRRKGDPPRLVADSKLARETLGFGKMRKGLKETLLSAWKWEQKKSKGLRRAIFLDRDGTINEDPGYLNHPSQLKLFEGVGEALAQLKAAGYFLVVVSNQSGVARGLIQKDVLPKIHQRLDEMLNSWSIKIDLYQLCTHHPDEGCSCRKPKPQLILDAAGVLGIDVSNSYMIGDKTSDILAGKAAGCKASILVRTGDGKKSEGELTQGHAAFIGDSLLHVAHWILAQENADS